jgi:hypothetical protein
VWDYNWLGLTRYYHKFLVWGSAEKDGIRLELLHGNHPEMGFMPMGRFGHVKNSIFYLT